jgi:hypothetical protein
VTFACTLAASLPAPAASTPCTTSLRDWRENWRAPRTDYL